MELKPCPFCGGVDITVYHHPGRGGMFRESWHVECNAEHCGNGTYHHEAEAEAIAAWNTCPTEQLQLAVEALEAVLDMIDGLYRNHDGWWLDDHDIAIARTSRDTLTRIKEATDADR